MSFLTARKDLKLFAIHPAKRKTKTAKTRIKYSLTNCVH